MKSLKAAIAAADEAAAGLSGAGPPAHRAVEVRDAGDADLEDVAEVQRVLPRLGARPVAEHRVEAVRRELEEEELGHELHERGLRGAPGKAPQVAVDLLGGTILV